MKPSAHYATDMDEYIAQWKLKPKQPGRIKRKAMGALGYSVGELAEAIGVHHQTIRHHIRKGNLAVMRITAGTKGHPHIRIAIPEVKRWLTAQGARHFRAFRT